MRKLTPDALAVILVFAVVVAAVILMSLGGA